MLTRIVFYFWNYLNNGKESRVGFHLGYLDIYYQQLSTRCQADAWEALSRLVWFAILKEKFWLLVKLQTRFDPGQRGRGYPTETQGLN